jgi:hypothetical protein
MTLEELKKFKNGICLGYSTIGYLLKNVFPFNSTEPNDVRYVQLRSYKDFGDSKVYPLIMYFKNESKEGILCRPMVYRNNLLSPIGLLHTNDDEPMAYIAKTEFMPLETNIDSIYEYKREPIILNR